MSTEAGLNTAGLARAVGELARRDEDLARVVATYGTPPLWAREPGFPTLVHIILEQQVSLASARAAFARLLALTGGRLTPRGFLALDDAALRAAGFSRQKTAYGRGLADALVSGRLDLARVARLGDEEARAELTQVKGVGRWTADIYLLMALGRPDVWPSGDLALAVAAQSVKRLPGRPNAVELEMLGEAWRPWRAVAARVLWHQYLSARARPTV
ncbi:MAG TPA: DNA-3-methyladenine glycosylase 2 family protein [Pyrinomonadaceae bacterium]|nr:DNA-3-methyladenine glycosylase 2 family protein [Pyrinomonadaceae bacterium]